MRRSQDGGLDQFFLDIFDEVVVIGGLAESIGSKGGVLDGEVQQLREADVVGDWLHRLILIHPQQLPIDQL